MGSTDSLESLVISSNSQDLESTSSGCSGWELMSSSFSGVIELNKENSEPEKEKAITPKKSVRTSSQVDLSEECLRDRDIINNDAGVELSTRALSGKKQASPRDFGKSVSGEKGKKDEGSPRFKRRVSCTQPLGAKNFDPSKKRLRLSSPKGKKNGQAPIIDKRKVISSQPIAAKDLTSRKNINLNLEIKKAAATATKMRLRAERAEQKLERARSQVKILYDTLMK